MTENLVKTKRHSCIFKIPFEDVSLSNIAFADRTMLYQANSTSVSVGRRQCQRFVMSLVLVYSSNCFNHCFVFCFTISKGLYYYYNMLLFFIFLQVHQYNLLTLHRDII